MKVEVNFKGVTPYTIDILDTADRLNDLAREMDVVALAIAGAVAEISTEGLGSVETYVWGIRERIRAVSDAIYHGPDEPGATADEEGEAVPS